MITTEIKTMDLYTFLFNFYLKKINMKNKLRGG